MKKPAPPSARRLLERGAQELERVGIPESQWEAERLLRHALGWTREYLLAHPEAPIQAEASGMFFQLVERRRGREPLQYVVGIQEFWGMELRVTPAVLIPRPETEGLVEQVLAHFKSNSSRLVDVGCGSGCIAIALAKELPEAEVYATETSHPALAVARDNAHRHNLGERIMFYQGDLLQPLFDKGLRQSVDAVISNPPYITVEEMESLAPEIREYEPRAALVAGNDGLEVIRRLLPEAEALLAPGGRLFLEIGKDMELPLKELLSKSELTWEKTVPDLQGIPRIVIAKKQLGGDAGTRVLGRNLLVDDLQR